jgi:hypothetical protein
MGKKTKKVKEKLVYFKSETYSGKFESLFNNKKYSDVTLKLEKSGETLNCHKSILSAASYFSDLFQKDNNLNEVVIKEENDSNFKDYIKFLYTGSFDIAKEDKIIPFILIANKVS